MLNITPIPAYSDNYIWMLQHDSQPQVVLVDPGQAEPVIKQLEAKKLQPVAILITHQHYDHTGGVSELLKKYPGLEVIGPAIAPSKVALRIDLEIPQLITRTVTDGDRVDLKEIDCSFEVMSIPGHTLDHLAYVGEGVVFCGDTLFAVGCGRLFSGTAQMMTDSINKLMALPADTRMYCAHEYTVDNLGFAKWVEPKSASVIARDETEMEKQEKGQPTVPTTVGLEKETNPFVRLQQTEVIEKAEAFAGKKLQQDWEVFAALREWKDTQYD